MIVGYSGNEEALTQRYEQTAAQQSFHDQAARLVGGYVGAEEGNRESKDTMYAQGRNGQERGAAYARQNSGLAIGR